MTALHAAPIAAPNDAAPLPLIPQIFREYDIRGVVGQELDVGTATTVGRTFATLVTAAGGKRVVLGYDGRLSSPSLAQACIAGLRAGGVDVINIGMVPTPMVYFAHATIPSDGAIMITGSHNPADYNGFKMVLQGKALYGDAIQDLYQLAKSGDFSSGSGSVEQRDIAPAYQQRLLESLQDMDSAKAPKVVWDPGNGATGDVVSALVGKLPGQHFLINATVDGTFPAHHPDPTVEANLKQLQQAVAANKADLGIAFDGDGDRIGVVDGQGRILWGDQLLLLYAEDLLQRLPGSTIIADVKASQVLFDGVAALGGKPVMWKAGHSLIKAAMKELHSPLAGEMSGHMFFAEDYYGFDDAIYGALLVLRILTKQGRSLADFYDTLPQPPSTPELRFPCEEADKFPIVERLQQRMQEQGADCVTIDGVRVTTADGWWLVRASNTQNILVARCEGRDGDALQRLKTTLSNELAACGLQVGTF
jgi:phosphomannomutase